MGISTQIATVDPRRDEKGIVPDRDTFRRLAGSGNLIPVYKEVIADFDTPVSALKKLGESEYAYLLESVEGGSRLGRYSFVGTSARCIFESRGHEVLISSDDEQRRLTVEDPLDALRDLLQSYRTVAVPGLPRFYGGAVGYMSYDMIRYWERIPDKNPDPLNLPESAFIITDTVLIFDHVRRKVQVVHNTQVDGDVDQAYDRAVARIEEVLAKLEGPHGMRPLTALHGRCEPADGVTSNFTKEEFVAAVERAKEYIRAGDVLQVVLAQRFSRSVRSDAFDIYRVLRSINPSPYLFYLKFGPFAVVGSSPEVMVRLEDGEALLRPIAGTRRRGASEAEDLALERELLADEKERAEHLMLVDLGRNDLSRVCEPGSVTVEDLMVVERYSHVMHIVSSVKGRLAADRDAFDLLRAAFPAGTLTGAPKIRAMEIIDELENVRRGPYGGAIGYFGFSGNMDSCITIRTVVICDGTAYVQAGAGVVADSNPESEFDETVNKARGLLTAIAVAEEATGHARGGDRHAAADR